MEKVLKGIRILDWTVLQQGPVATAMLGDLGAEVIKIEARGIGDHGRGLRAFCGVSTQLPSGRNFYFENNNRNKKSLAVDLTKEAGKQIVYDLARTSDVFVQNFRIGVAERMGLDYPTLSKLNPRLIYVHGSSVGPKGPDSALPFIDFTAQARSGIMMACGEEGTPPAFITGAVTDQVAAIMAAYGTLVALLGGDRARSECVSSGGNGTRTGVECGCGCGLGTAV